MAGPAPPGVATPATWVRAGEAAGQAPVRPNDGTKRTKTARTREVSFITLLCSQKTRPMRGRQWVGWGGPRGRSRRPWDISPHGSAFGHQRRRRSGLGCEWMGSVRSLDDPDWLRLVHGCPDATAFHLPPWAPAVAETYGFRPFVFVVGGVGRSAVPRPTVLEVRGPVGRRPPVS